MKITLLIVFLLLFSFCWSEKTDSGKLQDFEDKINKPVEHENDSDDDDDNDSDDDDDGNFLTDLILAVTYELFIGIPGDSYARREFLWSYMFNEYPYSSGNTGIYDVFTEKSSFLDLSSFYFYHNKDLDGQSYKFNFQFIPYLGLEGSYLKLTEKLENSTDKFEFYDLYLNYTRFRTQHINWWWGLGVKHLKRNNNYTGFSLATGWKIYPIKPVSFHLCFTGEFQ